MLTVTKMYFVIAFVAAVLTMMSRSSPLLSTDSLDKRIEESANSTSNITDNFLFNDTKGVAGPLTVFGGGERCETEPFCDDDEHPVPDDVQLKILEENFDQLKDFFEKDDKDAPHLYRTSQLLDAQNPAFVQACDTFKRIINRNDINDIAGNRHYLLNPKQGGYRQNIHYVKCRVDREPCTNVEVHIPLDRPTFCKTRLWRRVMKAINITTLETYEILVDVPGACTCYIRAQL